MDLISMWHGARLCPPANTKMPYESGSPSSALDRAAVIACGLDGELHVVQVFSRPPRVRRPGSDQRASQRREFRWRQAAPRAPRAWIAADCAVMTLMPRQVVQ